MTTKNQTEDTGSMTVREAGQKGGEARREQLGPERAPSRWVNRTGRRFSLRHERDRREALLRAA